MRSEQSSQCAIFNPEQYIPTCVLFQQISNKTESSQMRLVQSIYCQVPLKIKTSKSSQEIKKRKRWTKDEHKLYLQFICLNQEILESKNKHEKHSIYNQMSKFVPTRAKSLCKSHHQKMIKHYGSIDKILSEFLEDMLPGLDSTIPKSGQTNAEIEISRDKSKKKLYFSMYCQGDRCKHQVCNQCDKIMKETKTHVEVNFGLGKENSVEIFYSDDENSFLKSFDNEGLTQLDLGDILSFHSSNLL